MPRHLRGHLPRKHHRRWPPEKVFYLFGRLGKLHGNDGEIEGSNGFVGYLLIYLHGWLKLYGQLVGKYTINVGRGRIFTYMTG